MPSRIPVVLLPVSLSPVLLAFLFCAPSVMRGSWEEAGAKYDSGGASTIPGGDPQFRGAKYDSGGRSTIPAGRHIKLTKHEAGKMKDQLWDSNPRVQSTMP